MKSLIEWCFEFSIKSLKTIDRVIAELLLEVAVTWAEAHEYGIGGGFDAILVNNNVKGWLFKFGLTATRDNQLISEKDADALLAKLKQFCNDRGYKLDGGFREFTQKELEPFPTDDGTKA